MNCQLMYFLQQMVSRTAMNKDHGLVYRSFIYLFEQLEARKNDATFVVKASYLEIYNEKVEIFFTFIFILLDYIVIKTLSR